MTDLCEALTACHAQDKRDAVCQGKNACAMFNSHCAVQLYFEETKEPEWAASAALKL